MPDTPRVKLQNQSCPGELIVFNASPELSEGRAVNYAPLEPVHSPGQMMIYRNTQARTFELSEVKLISRSRDEATTNIESLQIIRSWALPVFGSSGGCSGGSSSTPPESEKPAPVEERSTKATPNPPPSTPSTPSPPAFQPGNPTTLTISARGILGSITKAASTASAISKGVAGGVAAVGGIAKAAGNLFAAGKKAVSSLPGAGGAGGGPAASSGASASAALGGGGGGDALGAPPAILLLSAYSHGTPVTNINRIPVVITNLSINYPTDVDYIPTNTGEPFPTIMSISLSLTEAHAPVEYERFNLSAFKSGNLPGF